MSKVGVKVTRFYGQRTAETELCAVKGGIDIVSPALEERIAMIHVLLKIYADNSIKA